jgi:hypothetical protein
MLLQQVAKSIAIFLHGQNRGVLRWVKPSWGENGGSCMVVFNTSVLDAALLEGGEFHLTAELVYSDTTPGNYSYKLV